ncbi:hypothetical protein L249_1679 [Ophiocordyceps polyrhachis-furcata BCC 54312]|uniref:Uncharacterized protein n=1 Tax=Ophiocordyceps polyrhachis-furcata BCC 54312 TaxID=1330021 RepID=A0A367KZL1_9HYPO|nr:hypothetical protein L249_1679 [Ophiocordyceps polyrhachis-furcata BCC 54312]
MSTFWPPKEACGFLGADSPYNWEADVKDSAGTQGEESCNPAVRISGGDQRGLPSSSYSVDRARLRLAFLYETDGLK